MFIDRLKNFIYSPPNSLQINLASLTLRLTFGALMMRYGIIKIMNFSEYSKDFLDLMGIGGTASLSMAIFGEFFCSLLVILGLGTRMALIPLMFTMLVAFFIAHANDPFQIKEHPLVFLFPYIALMLIGPGKYSLDHLILNKNK